MRSTPTSPLFPYTTLFRSGTGGRESRLQILEHLLQLGTKVRAAHQGAGRIERYLPGEVKESLPGGHFDQLGIATRRGDRKSTRLNSSHRCSSYAVFCLKKK